MGWEGKRVGARSSAAVCWWDQLRVCSSSVPALQAPEQKPASLTTGLEEKGDFVTSVSFQRGRELELWRLCVGACVCRRERRKVGTFGYSLCHMLLLPFLMVGSFVIVGGLFLFCFGGFFWLGKEGHTAGSFCSASTRERKILLPPLCLAKKVVMWFEKCKSVVCLFNNLMVKSWNSCYHKSSDMLRKCLDVKGIPLVGCCLLIGVCSVIQKAHWKVSK